MEIFLRGMNYDNNRPHVLNIDDNNNIRIESSVMDKINKIYNQSLILKNYKLYNDLRYHRNQGNCYSVNVFNYSSNINNISNNVFQIFNRNNSPNYKVFVYFIKFTMSNSTDISTTSGLRLFKATTECTKSPMSNTNISNLNLNGPEIPDNIKFYNKPTQSELQNSSINAKNNILYSKLAKFNNNWQRFEKLEDIDLQEEMIEIPPGYGLNFNVIESTYIYYTFIAKLLVLPETNEFPMANFLN